MLFYLLRGDYMKDNNRNNNLEYFLESEKGGVYKLFKCDPLNYSNIGSIKQVLYNKSRVKKGNDKDFYYNLAVNLNKNNLGQSLQKIDSYIEKRKSKVIQIGASALKIFKFIKAGQLLSFGQLFLLLVAMGVAFAVSMVAIRFLTSYVKKHDFTLFGKYRIVLGSVLLLYSFVRLFV